MMMPAMTPALEDDLNTGLCAVKNVGLELSLLSVD